MSKLFEMMQFTKAAVSAGLEPKCIISGASYFFAYYLFNAKKEERDSRKFDVEPDMEEGQKIVDMLDTSLIRNLFDSTLKSIKFRKIFFLKRTEIKITKELISNFIDKIKKGDFQSINLNIASKRVYGDLLKSEVKKNQQDGKKKKFNIIMF